MLIRGTLKVQTHAKGVYIILLYPITVTDLARLLDTCRITKSFVFYKTKEIY